MKRLLITIGLSAATALGAMAQLPQSWTADNGNGTFTNPLFYDEFSDPDMIRVGDDFYLAGTTMHSLPGIVILHSSDLVNWEFCSYVINRLDLGEEFNLQNHREAYGQGIWAPAIRYHNGTFYIFSNINGHGLQVFTAKDIHGPWTHKQFGARIYDLSVLFDDDGKIYAVHGYDEVHLVEVNSTVDGIVEGTDKVIIPRGNNMGEGHHIYKINGWYYICSANYSPTGRMQCARSKSPWGPYETTVISTNETMGYKPGPGVGNVFNVPLGAEDFKFDVYFPGDNQIACVPIHQGGLVDLPNGEWWGFSMMDFHAVGRTTCLSPITWKDNWPYFGLEGNLGRSPRTWVKPAVDAKVAPHAPYDRNDDFNSKAMKPVWQFNHNPVEGKYKFTGAAYRIYTQPAENFMWAKNTLTQRCMGPTSVSTVKLSASKLKAGDIAGLGLQNWPYATIGVKFDGKEYSVVTHDQLKQRDWAAKLQGPTVWLRAIGDYDDNRAILAYSEDGKEFKVLGDSILLPYQLKTFQGIRLSLFAFNQGSANGGYADFDDFTVVEPKADRSKNIPYGKVITMKNLQSGLYLWGSAHGMARQLHEINPETKFEVVDKGQGKVALRCLSGRGYLYVTGEGMSGDLRIVDKLDDSALFMWQDLLDNKFMLMSMKNHRYVGIDSSTGAPYSVDYAGCSPNLMNGTVLVWASAN